MNETEREYQRLMKIFESSDPKKLDVLSGLVLETARCKVDLDGLNIIAEKSGLIRFNPNNFKEQKPTTVANELTKMRASYTHMLTGLCRQLNVNAEEIDELSRFEDE